MINGLKIGVIAGADGKTVEGKEYPRSSFDAALWASMKPGDKMILPAGATLPDDLGTFSSVSFGRALHLSKMSDTIGAGQSIVGASFDSL